ncbi:hypothetical protein [uncultured Jatrophihabitans sp.]|uniref:hypothetical protein n=1 Tax=uncultured Jatrophihabitans sp. TaxID=1610747 RepID=UPI0035C9C900
MRQFSNALTPAARTHLRLDYESIALIRTACETHTPRQLAQTVAKGIGWRNPANAPALLLYRLRRAAGQLEQDTDPEPEETPA